MILGIEDITGGATIVAILVWLGLSAAFYFVCYIVVINVIDDLSRNNPMKIAMMLGAAIPAAGLMAILNYKPLILAIIMAGSNFFRVKDLDKKPRPGLQGITINKPLFYVASYTYIAAVVVLAYYFQGEKFSP